MSDEEKEVHQWLSAFKTDTDLRLRAATELGLIGIRAQKLGHSIRGDFERVASSAFSGISFMDFLETALADEREEVQCEAVIAVGELAGEEVVDPLLQALRSFQSKPELQAAIERALGNIGGPNISSVLLEGQITKGTARSITSLLNRQEDRDEEFTKQLHTPVLGDMETGTLASQIRRKLEEIRDTHEKEYVRLVIRQVLPE